MSGHGTTLAVRPCRSRLQRVDTSYTICEREHGHKGEHRAELSRGAIVWTDKEADPKQAQA